MDFDVVVIGAGPGGYVSAIRSSQLGMKTAIIEREFLGGVCLNVGCIPSKAMISAAKFLYQSQHKAADMGIEIGSVKLNMKKLKGWKQSVSDKMSGGVGQLLKANKVEVVRGEAEFQDKNTIVVDGKKITAKNFVVATGSRPIEIPTFKYDEKDILSSTGALDLEKVPESLIVIGGGYIGLEIGGYLNKLGSKVTVLEAGDKLLSGLCDEDVFKQIERSVKKQGLSINYKAFAKSYKKSGKQIEVTTDVNGEPKTFKAEKVLVTVGRKPNSDELGLNKIGIKLDDHGFIAIDPQCRTNISNIFAIGDIAGQPLLAHKASHEGVLAAEVISGENRVFDAKVIPAVIFTDPEIAWVGLNEKEAKEKGYTDLKIGKFPFGANGKAVSKMETDGFVKIIADGKTHAVIGVHIIGPEASNLISEAALAMEMGATLEDLALTIHPHPTLGETMMECAEAALGHAIHIIQKPVLGKSKASKETSSETDAGNGKSARA